MTRREWASGASVLILLLAVCDTLLNIPPVRGAGTIYIRADGRVDPPVAQIHRTGDLYVFTGSLSYEIVVERSNIVIDGNGHTLQGTFANGMTDGIYLFGRTNVTIRNTNIIGFWYNIVVNSSFSINIVKNSITESGGVGIYIVNSAHNTISENNVIANHWDGIMLWDSSNSNIIQSNNVTGNSQGIRLLGGPNNTLSGNRVSANSEGISLASSDNVLRDNTMEDNRFNLCVYSGGANDIDESNIINGKPILYLVDRHDIIINPSTYPSVGYLAVVDSFNVTVRDLIIDNHNDRGVLFVHTTNSSIQNVTVTEHLYGITLSDSSNNTLSKNNIALNVAGGFEIVRSHYNTISRNIVVANGGVGLRFDSSSDNILLGNIVASNGGSGIFVNGYDNIVVANTVTANDHGSGVSLHTGYRNLVYGNNITGNSEGVDVHDGYRNVIYGNNITDNSVGISRDWTLGTTVYHNNFINNPIQSSKEDYGDFFETTWDSGYPVGGNYWSDYTGMDLYSGLFQNETGSDGLGDISYVIDANNRDKFPLMTVVGHLTPFSTNDYDDLWHTTDFQIILKSIDDHYVAATYYRINNGVIQTTSTDGQPLISTEGSNNKLEYWSVDGSGNEEQPHKILTGIKLDKTAPSGSITLNNAAQYTASTSVTLNLTATDVASGVYQIRLSNDGVWDTEPWEWPRSTKAWNLASGDGTKVVYYQVKDYMEFVSQTYSDSIILSTIPPTGSIIIDNGRAYANSTQVTLTLSTTIATSGIAQMRFSNNKLMWSSWETFSTSKSWTLLGRDGVTEVTAQYKDNAGLISSYSDSIILDTTKPNADSGVDQTIDEDKQVAFDGSASQDENGIQTYTWTFTDVTVKTLTGEKSAYTFNVPGTYTVTLNVTDAAGNWATDSLILTVLDVTKPVADAGQDQTVNGDTVVSFDSGGSTDNVRITNYEWSFGDGATEMSSAATHTYTTPGTYTVTLSVKDAAGNVATGSITVTVRSPEAPPPSEAFSLWTIAGAIIAIGITVAAALLWKQRKQT